MTMPAGRVYHQIVKEQDIMIELDIHRNRWCPVLTPMVWPL